MPLTDRLHAGTASLEILERIQEENERRKSGSCVLAGYETGLSDLDKATSGLEPGELVLIGAGPSVGKTTLGVQIAHHVATHDGPAVIVSLEMSRESIIHRRLVPMIARVDLRQTLAPEPAKNVIRACESLEKLPLYIDDSRPTIDQIICKVTRLSSMIGGVKLIVVDYLQLIPGTRRRDDTRDRQLGEYTSAFKLLAGQLSCPVLPLAQLNRDTEKQGRKPKLSDIRETGCAEQDADQIWLLNREQESEDGEPEPIELIIAKHRNYGRGSVNLLLIQEQTRFVCASQREDKPVF